MPNCLTMLALCAGLLPVALSHAGPADGNARALRLGILPFTSPDRIEASYGPLAMAIGTSLQRPVELRTRSSFAGFSRALAERRFDVALIQPFDYVNAADRGDYLPLARMREPLSAVIIVPADSAIRDMAGLRRQVITLPPDTAAVSLLGGPMLKQAGLSAGQDVQLRHMRSHDACMLEVLQGRSAACVTTRAAMNIYANRRGLAFRVLAESGVLPHILFVVRADLAPAERDRLMASVMQWYDSEAGRQLLARAGVKGGFVPAMDSDYDIVRKLRDSSADR